MLPLRTKQAFDLLTSKEICDEIYKKICLLIKIKIKEGMCTLLICSNFFFFIIDLILTVALATLKAAIFCRELSLQMIELKGNALQVV
jgi:hypothetical protein